MKTLIAIVTIVFLIVIGCSSEQNNDSPINKNTIDSTTSTTPLNKVVNDDLTTIKEEEQEEESAQMYSGRKAEEVFAQIQNKELPAVFRGLGSEPFWDIFITADYLLYNNLADNSFYLYDLLTPFDKDKMEQVIKFQDSDAKTFELIIEKKPSDDGMSEKIYAYSLNWSENSLNGVGELAK
jgi:uncharacterized membrane protein